MVMPGSLDAILNLWALLLVYHPFIQSATCFRVQVIQQTQADATLACAYLCLVHTTGTQCRATAQCCIAVRHFACILKFILIPYGKSVNVAYIQALGKVLPAVAQHKLDRGGFMILRPDSGDPTEAVLAALHAAEEVFGVDVNSKGFKVPRGCGVIQGDGIKFERLSEILDAVLAEKYSAQVSRPCACGGKPVAWSNGTTMLAHLVPAPKTWGLLQYTGTLGFMLARLQEACSPDCYLLLQLYCVILVYNTLQAVIAGYQPRCALVEGEIHCLAEHVMMHTSFHLLLQPVSLSHAEVCVCKLRYIMLCLDHELFLPSSEVSLLSEISPCICLQAVAFGMGGGLLQKVNRDTMSFSTKLSHIVYADCSSSDIMKAPAKDTSKASLPGALAVKRVNGIPTAFPADSGEVAPEDNLLQTVYDCRPVKVGIVSLLSWNPYW